jgi:hypothetical protein
MKTHLTSLLILLLLNGCSTPGRIVGTMLSAGAGSGIGNELGGTTGALLGGAAGAGISEVVQNVAQRKVQKAVNEGIIQGRAEAMRTYSEELRKSNWPSPPARFDARDYIENTEADYLVVPIQALP